MASKYNFRKVLINNYLGVSKEIKAQTEWELELKISEQERKWAEQTERKLEKERILDLKEQAENLDTEAKREYEEYKQLLSEVQDVDYVVNWNKMLRKDQYKSFQFTEKPPVLEDILEQFQVPKKSFLENIFKSKKTLRLKKEEEAQLAFNDETRQYYERKNNAQIKYNTEKHKFEAEKKKYNDDILLWKKQFEEGERFATERYLGVVLANSHYPDAISGENEVAYDSDSKTAIVSFDLPTPEDLPQYTGYKFVASRKAIEEIPMKVTEKKKYYEDVVQQLAIRTIYELFKGVYAKGVLESVVFNGWVNGIDKATGQDYEACILSVQASREEFNKINLERIEPKECLRSLKAVSAGPLQNLAPVRPLMELDRDDKRFVSSVEVLKNMDEETNLATMPWEDFEHLVRELFSRIFSGDGSEVKVTQASRYGGVDAIAFDPDPIRGGKFVIQAKRYNNVVPV